jgi:succinate-semialdehyde dehydrogenase/glutarate-semialdehyde dehydrogenase
VGITTFQTREEAVALANATRAGLAAYVFTRSLGNVFRLTEVSLLKSAGHQPLLFALLPASSVAEPREGHSAPRFREPVHWLCGVSGQRLEYGMVGVNTGAISNVAAPFGGVKESGKLPPEGAGDCRAAL